MRMFRTLLVVLMMLGAGFAHAEPVFPLGLRVGLEPAGDLKTGPGVAGFQDSERKTSVFIAELPLTAYEELRRAVFGQDPPGARDVHRTLFSLQDGVGYLHEARVVENGVAIKRWLLLAMPAGQQSPFTIVINVSVPDSANAIYSDAVVRQMLTSVTVRKAPIEEQLGLIPFKLEELAGFHITNVTPDSVFALDGPSDDPNGRPYVFVAVGRAPADQMDDRARFSRDLLSRSPVRNMTLESAESMRIGGSPGFEIRAQAEDERNHKILVVQWIRFLGNGFIRVVGVAPSEKWDEMFGRFRAVRDGVALR